MLNKELEGSAVMNEGFEWLNDQKDGRTPKWGFIGDKPGAKLKFKVDSTTKAFKAKKGVPYTALTLNFLRSYEHMGKAGTQKLHKQLRVPLQRPFHRI